MENLKEKYDILIEKLNNKQVKFSYSSLKKFYENPSSFISYKLADFERTPSMLFGTLLDCLILTPEDFDKK